jgi:hypothetical protein
MSGTLKANPRCIDTLEVIDSSLGRRPLRLALAWAELHQDELMENWRSGASW